MDQRPSKFGVYQLNGKYVVKNNMTTSDTIVRHDGQPADNALREDMRYFGMSLADAGALAELLCERHQS